MPSSIRDFSTDGGVSLVTVNWAHPKPGRLIVDVFVPQSVNHPVHGSTIDGYRDS
jgi:hypothetical protein